MRVHLDHNATTPLRPEARARWLEVADELGGNPSSLNAGGRRARAVIDDARARVAAALAVREDEIVFTSGGTESNNLALRGVLEARSRGGRPAGLLTTAVEHASVLAPARALASRGHELALVPVDGWARPDLGALVEGISPATALVSVMAANNEVGTAPDLGAVARVLGTLERPRPLFHTDAVQALGRLGVDLAGWGVDLASFSAHKVGGPVGVGVLWCRAGVPLASQALGGEQEDGRRAGTEDAAGIAAAAEAIALAVNEQPELARRTDGLVRELWARLSRRVPGLEQVGIPLEADERARAGASRLPNTLCIRVPDTDGKVLVTRLDLLGIEASAGSACASGSIEPSHVLLAMGHDEDTARAGLRLSLGRNTSHAECVQAADLLGDLLVSSHAR